MLRIFLLLWGFQTLRLVKDLNPDPRSWMLASYSGWLGWCQEASHKL